MILAITYNMVSAEKEQGTLALALSQPVSLATLVTGKVTLRALLLVGVVLVVAVAALLVTGTSLAAPGALARLALWVAVVAAYGAFWFSLAVFASSLGRNSATTATLLASAWLVLVVLLPSLFNLVVTTVYPVPSRVEMVQATREASDEANAEGSKLLAAYYGDHPELAGGGADQARNDFNVIRVAVNDDVERLGRPVIERMKRRSGGSSRRSTASASVTGRARPGCAERRLRHRRPAAPTLHGPGDGLSRRVARLLHAARLPEDPAHHARTDTPLPLRRGADGRGGWSGGRGARRPGPAGVRTRLAGVGAAAPLPGRLIAADRPGLPVGLCGNSPQPPATALDLSCRVMSPVPAVTLCLSLLVSFALAAPLGAAQEALNHASLAGRVTDTQGGVLPGVAVTVTHVETAVAVSATTDATGRFRFPYLRIGAYELTASLSGFRREARRFVLSAGSAFEVPVVLGVEGIEAAVRVTAEAPLIESARSQVATTMGEEEVRNLPLNGRNVLDVALLAPSVAPPNINSTQLFAETSAVPGVGLSVGGQRNLSNNFIVDGLSANDDAAGLTGMPQASMPWSRCRWSPRAVRPNSAAPSAAT